ncbi:M23 family metallopeptidase [Curvibacter lanceolatus]|uniref:M23 family metallopeptidase n=1 Tax=Curvibacter lanceolatus TaxID=86182 RepID=UPI0012FBAC89|nr:M23 family metallopeptidase [Curvibacter lanceolatus]
MLVCFVGVRPWPQGLLPPVRSALAALAVLICLCCSQTAWADIPYPFFVREVDVIDGKRLVAENEGFAPVSIMVRLTESSNVTASRPLPIAAVIPPRSTEVVTTLTAANRQAPWGFRYIYHHFVGDFKAQPAGEWPYRIPVDPVQGTRISQGPGGPLTSHDNGYSRHAVDIPVPIGTPVLAARAGTVIDTRLGSNQGGMEPTYAGEANYVRVLHDDGTQALYWHLKQNGVLVRPGARVAEGQMLGLSGNTGYSSAPHLHFAVQVTRAMRDHFEAVSVPFVFKRSAAPGLVVPKAGLELWK